MADLPRLPTPLEHRIVKFVCGLPPRGLRFLFGAPPAQGGQRLAADIHALIWLDRLAGGESFGGGKSVEATRAERRHEARVVAHRPPIAMARVESVEIPGPAGPMRARLFVPPAAAGGAATAGSGRSSAPLLVYFHGGGWVIGDLDTHDDPCRFLAAHSGARVLSVDYRLAPEHPFPAAPEDAFTAFAWATEHAEQLGADPQRIGVGGDSAGGNLAAAACLAARDDGGPSPAMQLLIYPVTETAGTAASRQTFSEGFMLTRADMDWFEERYLPPGVNRGDPRVALLNAADLAGLPPAYVATAGFDPLRDEGEEFARRLHEAGVQVALRRHPGLVHAFANLTAICPTARAAMLEAAGALRMGLGA
ncbi:MAG TPA: alpha/beta hydrolase [Solirubrobacterales bacterium]|nr:alpha/beta hydrolase [Solirubrobacterales bacterium]